MNRLIFFVDNNDNIINTPVVTLRGKSNYQTEVVYISPKPLTMPIMANWIAYGSRNQLYTQFLAPTNGKGKDYADVDAPYYEEVKYWNVWKAPIKSKVISDISRYYAGKIGLSFSAFNVILDERATNYIGEFGLNDLPSVAVEGDYMKCIKPRYTSPSTLLEFTYGQIAVWNNGKWIKAGKYTGNYNTTTVVITVDPSVIGEVAEIPEEDIVDVYEKMGDLQEQFNNFTEDVFYKDGSEKATGDFDLDNHNINNVENINANKLNVNEINDTNKPVVFNGQAVFKTSITGDNNMLVVIGDILNMYSGQIKEVLKGTSINDVATLENLYEHITVEEVEW